MHKIFERQTNHGGRKDVQKITLRISSGSNENQLAGQAAECQETSNGQYPQYPKLLSNKLLKCYSNAFKKHQNNTGTICLNIILWTWDMFLHNGFTELHIVFMTKSTTFFRSTVFAISRLSCKGNPLKVYFEEAQKQACNYSENVLSYRCFFLGTWPKLMEQLF